MLGGSRAAPCDGTLLANTARPGPIRPGAPIAYLLDFFGVLIVSITVVLGRRCASFTGMNSPILASRPIFFEPMWASADGSTGRMQSLALGRVDRQNGTTTV